MSRRQLLWLSHFIPYPPRGGCFQRSFHLLKEVAGRADIYLVCMKNKGRNHPDCDVDEAQRELRQVCKEVTVVDVSSTADGYGFYRTALKSLFTSTPMTVNLFKSPRMREAIVELTQRHRFDLAHFDTISLAEYLDVLGEVPAVLNHHGVESFMVKRRSENEGNPLNRLFLWIEASKLEGYEKRHCREFKLNLTVSELDKGLLQQIAGPLDVEVIENGVDIDYFSGSNAVVRDKRIIFAGRLDQYSNRRSILFFCSRIWPLVKAREPDARFTIIGNKPPAELVDTARKDGQIDLLGYVEDVRPYFARSMVSVCPIIDGGGTRIKILDAMAMGMPIVSTKIGCEGLAVTPGVDLYVAESAADFAVKIAALLSDPEARRSLGEQARRTVEEKYDWKRIGQKLNQAYDRCV